MQGSSFMDNILNINTAHSTIYSQSPHKSLLDS